MIPAGLALSAQERKRAVGRGRGPNGDMLVFFLQNQQVDNRPYSERVNQPETQAELEALRRSVARSQPFGSAAWHEETAERLGLQSTFRAPGRPRKQTGKARQ